SVKSNIGHLELAAGVAGIIKVLLQLKHKTLVKSLHCEELNPYIQLQGSPFFIVRQNQPWEAPRDAVGRELPRRAGISSFGFGGANAHVVIEEYVAPAAPPPPPAPSPAQPALVVLSARNEARLHEQVRQLLDAIAQHPFTDEDLPNIAYTLQVGRSAMDSRVALTAASIEELQRKLASIADGRPAGDDIYQADARRSKDAMAALAADDDHRQLVQAWMAGSKHGKLLDLWVKGLPLDWQQLYGGRMPRRISLPTYPFARERHWVTEPADVGTPKGGVAVLHPLLQQNTSDFTEQRFSSRFTGKEFFLADHVLQGTPVLPGVAYLEMARLAVARATGALDHGTGIVLKDIVWARPLMLSGAAASVDIALYPHENGEIGYEIRSTAWAPAGEEPAREHHAQGRAAIVHGERDVPRIDLAACKRECPRPIDAAQAYSALDAMGLALGPALRAMDSLHAGADGRGRAQVLARMRLPPCASEGREQYVLHPSLMDASIQAALGLALTGDAPADAKLKPLLPFALQRLEIFGRCPDTGWAVIRHADAAAPSEKAQTLDITLCDDEGAVSMRMLGLSLRLLEGELSGQAPVPSAAAAQARLPLAAKLEPEPEAEADEFAGPVRDWLKRTLSHLLKVKRENIEADTELADYGIDSIKFIELTNAVNEELKLELVPPIFFEYSTLGSFTGFLLHRQRDAVARRFAGTRPRALPTRATAGALSSEEQPALQLPARRYLRQARIETALARPAEPVAIIGISGRFPMAQDADALWSNLAQGRDCIGEIPDSRWGWGAIPTKWGGVIDGIDEFDPLFFNISPREALLMDPQQRLLMTYVWKAIEDAGYSAESMSGTKTALFVGTMASGYAGLVAQAKIEIDGYSATGAAPSVGPNRMSYFLNLHGPSEPIETACSSSLIAVHRALQALDTDGCEMAIAGGVNTLVAPEIHISFSKAGMLSEDGRCKSFSSSANGYVRGEGVGMLLLKKLGA
ncbi:MAG: polyketide synthase dehydratase domain-containing protein, partial [Ramlibacter sp.]|nr:polyketide synthase dehydratase domain-containing protein [Ramlibacter sp.]